MIELFDWGVKGFSPLRRLLVTTFVPGVVLSVLVLSTIGVLKLFGFLD
jgi:hypothetical protein